MDVRRSVREPDFDADVNVLGTIRLLQNCVEYGVGRVIFASAGGAVYGEQETFPATEDHPQYPLSPYGVSKLAGERYLHFYYMQHGLPYSALRYANVYGPRQDPHGEAGVVAIFCGNLAAGKASTINHTGEQTRDYVYVEEDASLIWSSARGGGLESGICSPRGERLTIMRARAEIAFPPKADPAPLAGRETPWTTWPVCARNTPSPD